jgi:outer membrane protein TolC
VPEIEVLRLQSQYEVIRQKRYLAEQQQRLTRAQLADAMGYPQQLPRDLEVPSINSERKLPEDIEIVVQQALNHSLEARLAQTHTRAAQAAIGIAESTNNPSLDLEFEVSSYERDSRLRDDWR